jgi:hypothetical protein
MDDFLVPDFANYNVGRVKLETYNMHQFILHITSVESHELPVLEML